MQNRYTGDIGDFSKLGILRALQSAGLSIGLNWYLTPDETHNSDGLHVGYLNQKNFRTCDEELWLGLKDIVESGHREVHRMENDRILKARCKDLFYVQQHDELVRSGYSPNAKGLRLKLRRPHSV